MLQKLRDQTQSLGFKILVGIIILVLAIFGFGAFNLFLDSDPEAAVVNGTEISQNKLLVEIEREKRRLAGQFGESFDPALLDTPALRQSVLDRLVTRTLLADAADNFKLGVSPERVNQQILEDQTFQNEDGRFDQDRYLQLVRSMGFTPASYTDEVSQNSALNQMRTGFMDSAFLLDWEQRAMAALADQKRDVAYLTFDPTAFQDRVEVTEADIAAHYDASPLDYMTEERSDIDYVVLKLEDLLQDPSIEINEDDLQAAYDRQKAEYQPEERRRASHILLNVTGERDETATLEAAEQIRQRLIAGESFEDLAKELSDDPGSAANGGDLGFAGKGVFVPPFEQTVWALTPGELSDPVQTEFGIHVIRLEEIEAAVYPELDAQREELERSLRRDRAQPLYEERVKELDQIAFEQPGDLQPIVDQLGLTIARESGVTRSLGRGVFVSPELREAIFDVEVLDDGNNSPAIAIENAVGGEQVVVARVAEHFPSEPIPLADATDDIRRLLVRTESEALADAALSDAYEALVANAATGDVANQYGLTWQTADSARRNQPGIPRSILTKAFELPKPGSSGKSLAQDPSTRSVVTVTRVQDGDVSSMTDAELANLERYLDQRAGNLDFTSLYRTLEANASIDYR